MHPSHTISLPEQSRHWKTPGAIVQWTHISDGQHPPAVQTDQFFKEQIGLWFKISKRLILGEYLSHCEIAENCYTPL